MSLAELARFIAAEPDFDTRWRLVVDPSSAARRHMGVIVSELLLVTGLRVGFRVFAKPEAW
jgi:hypothetical protein